MLSLFLNKLKCFLLSTWCLLKSPSLLVLVAFAVGTKHTDISEHDYDLINLDNSDHEQVTKEGDNVDKAEIAAIQKSDDTSTLSLHNSFEILNEESELPSGEAKLADKDTW